MSEMDQLQSGSSNYNPDSERIFIDLSGASISLPRLASHERIAAALANFRLLYFREANSIAEMRQLVKGQDIIIFDTEYTTWDGAMRRGWNGRGEYQELVQIGAVRVNLDFPDRPVSELNIIIRPKINPQLSPYFVNLTGITQERLDRESVSFEEALIKLFTFSDGGTLPLLSYGQDGEQLAGNASMYGIILPDFPGGLYDLRPFFGAVGIDTDNYTSGTIHRAVGIHMNVSVHDALDDSKSLFVTLREVMREQ